MPLLYALVASAAGASGCVLAEFASTTGNFGDVAHQLVASVAKRTAGSSNKRRKSTYVVDGGHAFHVISDDGLIFIALADEAFGRRIPFVFLKRVSALFGVEFGARGKVTVVPYAFNADFAPVLQQQMRAHNAGTGRDSEDQLKKTDMVRKDLDGVIDATKHNIEKVLERGEKLDHLVVQTDTLVSSADDFRSSSRALYRHVWLQGARGKCCVAAVVIMIFIYGYWIS